MKFLPKLLLITTATTLLPVFISFIKLVVLNAEGDFSKYIYGLPTDQGMVANADHKGNVWVQSNDWNLYERRFGQKYFEKYTKSIGAKFDQIYVDSENNVWFPSNLHYEKNKMVVII